jgi:TolB-like protein/tetratricopeptide (TPR) repeat protein
MTPERWLRLTDLFEAALDLEPGERAAFLASACADDDEMQREVSLLIESHERAGDLGTSPVFHIRAASVLAPAEAMEQRLDEGVRLGRYEIVSLVGSGGMGRVYRARDPQLGRDVGVKVLPQGAGIGGDQLARFGREARALAALNHPNILTVYDVGLDREIPYVVSELLEGDTLRARLQRGRLPVGETIALARQIASGLAAAHDKGIIHRDLKPENLFVARDGVVKILDFGLAKQATEAAGDRDRLERGYVMGTAGYMSPEQVRGHEADARSDLFSFGAVLHEMLTGRRAFAEDSAIETMRAVCTASPAGADDVPADFRAIVERCLAKDPAARFDSAHDVAAALMPVTVASQTTSPRARTYMTYGAAIAMVIAAVAAVLTVQRREAPPGPGPAGRQALAIMPFDDRSNDPANAWLSNGVPSMLVTSLAQTPGLDVIGTDRLEASFRELGLAPTDRSARHKVAQRAGAGAVLIGTIFKVGSDTRLEVQVHDVETGRVVVARVARGSDLFGVVDGIAQEVRTALDVAGRSNMRPLRDVTTASLGAYEMYAKAQRARHNNRYGDARTLFEEAVRIDPAFTLARAQLVEILERLGEEAAAAAGRKIVTTQLNRLPERQRLLTEALHEHDTNPAKAVELLERLLERYPDEEEAYDLIVHAYTHTRDPAYHKKTLAFMQRWARAIPGPGSGHFHNHYGYAYIEHGLFTEAEREFRAYIRVSPDEANGYDSLAELFLLTGRPAMSVEYYDQALRLNPLFGWSHYGRAYALAALGRYDEAFVSLRTLQNLGSRSAVPAAAIHVLDALLCSRVGLHAKAANHLEAARRLAHELGDGGARADVDLIDAAFAVERGQHSRAVEYANRFADAVPRPALDIMNARRLALGHLIAGIAEVRRGRIDGAGLRMAELRALDAGRDPIQASWQQALTGEIALAERRLDDAETAFRASEYYIASSFAIHPSLVALINNLPFRDGLARTAAARGDLRRAVDLYRQLNQPDVTSTWTSVFDPRYTRAAAELAARAGDVSRGRAERARFLEIWKGTM